MKKKKRELDDLIKMMRRKDTTELRREELRITYKEYLLALSFLW